jgi:hypothetical protein
MDETTRDELVGLLEDVETETADAACYLIKSEYTSARLCAEDACNLLADFIVLVRELESA